MTRRMSIVCALGLSITAICALAQERFVSSLDGNRYEIRRRGELGLDLYTADGALAAVMERKKPEGNFKGRTQRLATSCPQNSGKIETTHMLPDRVRMRVETPSMNMNGQKACNMLILSDWQTFELVKEQTTGGVNQSPPSPPTPVAATGETAASEGAARTPTRSVSVEDYRFTLLRCVRTGLQVNCELQLESATDEDRTLIIVSQNHGGIALGILNDHPTRLVAESGTSWPASRVRLANQGSAENGQSYFQVFGRTRPKLVATFENVGLTIKRAARIDLGAILRDGYKKLPVRFTDVPLEEETPSASSGSPAVESGRPRIAGSDWRFELDACVRSDGDIACGVSITNLGDSERRLFISEIDAGPAAFGARRGDVATLVDEEGRAYPAREVRINGAKDARPESAARKFKPFERASVEFVFRNVPRSITEILRFDVPAAALEDSGPQRLAIRFTRIPTESAPRPPK